MRVDVAERRARIGVRHLLAAGHRAAGPQVARDVTDAMTVLHATEPASVHLAVHARADAASVDDVERALHDDRSIVKQLAMRRTLFAFPRDLLPAAWGSAAARTAGTERARLLKDVAAFDIAGPGGDPEVWLAAATRAVLDRLAGGEALPAARLREELPELAGRWDGAPGKTYGGMGPIAPRVLTLLGAQGLIVRGRNAGHWRTSRPAWVATSCWLGGDPDPRVDALPSREGYAVLVARWLATFGPGTTADLVWWLGATKTIVAAALADVGAVEVEAEVAPGEWGPGWVLPDDPVLAGRRTEVAGWVALLPVLDPTVMGWQGGTGTSATTPPSSSTPTATRARPPGSTAGRSAAGCRTSTAWCTSSSSSRCRSAGCGSSSARPPG